MLLRPIVLHPVLRLLPLFVCLRGAVLLTGSGTRRRTTPAHELGTVCFFLYLSCLCSITVNTARILRGHFEMGENYNLVPFREILGMASGGDTVYAVLNIAGNVALFAPLGLLLPLLWRGWGAGRIFWAALLLSGSIETLQLFTGRSADVDDVMLNVLGGLMGYLVYRYLRAARPDAVAAFRLRGEPRQPGHSRHRRIQPKKSPAEDRRGARGGFSAPGPRRGSRGVALVTTIAAVCVLASAGFLLGSSGGYPPLAAAGLSPAVRQQPDAEPVPPVHLDIPAVNSANILLASADMTRILYEQGAQQRIYPASLTKMMTAVLALEEIGDMQALVPVGEDIFADIYRKNLSTAGFLPGEEARALDLVYGVMLPSGAECSIALARHIAGSETAFAALMNEKARELGMSGTQFVNATGAHHPDHYTTAHDLALLLSYALENPMFRAVASTQLHCTAPTNLHTQGLIFSSTLLGRVERTTLPGGALTGGKTGYTDEAGQCLASFAEIDGRDYILITAGARPKDFRVEQLHIDDAFTVYRMLDEIEVAGVV